MLVLFIGVLLDTFTDSLVFIFLTVMLVVAVLLLCWLSPVYVAVIVCFSTLVGVYVCVAIPLLFVLMLNVLSLTFIVMFWFAS